MGNPGTQGLVGNKRILLLIWGHSASAARGGCMCEGDIQEPFLAEGRAFLLVQSLTLSPKA